MSDKEFIIGVDDTDSLESRGTGHIVRTLALHLKSMGLFDPKCIVRHQLFFHPDIPFTSHNSSASVYGILKVEEKELINESESFLLTNSAEGSDAGFCLTDFSNPKLHEISDFGRRAKRSIVTKVMAHELAESANVYLNGLVGEKIGVIGALAAVGLFATKSDGRVLWTPNLRETEGVLLAKEIPNHIGIDRLLNLDCMDVPANDRVYLSDWTRPVCYDGKITLFVEPTENINYEYQTASKSFIKSISE